MEIRDRRHHGLPQNGRPWLDFTADLEPARWPVGLAAPAAGVRRRACRCSGSCSMTSNGADHARLARRGGATALSLRPCPNVRL